MKILKRLVERYGHLSGKDAFRLGEMDGRLITLTGSEKRKAKREEKEKEKKKKSKSFFFRE